MHKCALATMISANERRATGVGRTQRRHQSYAKEIHFPQHSLAAQKTVTINKYRREDVKHAHTAD